MWILYSATYRFQSVKCHSFIAIHLVHVSCVLFFWFFSVTAIFVYALRAALYLVKEEVHTYMY